MRFTKAQLALFRDGVSFVHMAPDQRRRDAAERDFRAAVREAKIEAKEGDGDCCEDCKTRLPGTQFIVCSLTGACSEHVSALFIEDEKDIQGERNLRALDEAKFIASNVNGCGPMVIRG